MDKINSKEVQVSLNENCSNRTDEKNRKNGITLQEQRNIKLHFKDCPIYDLVKQSEENSFNLLKLKRKQKQMQDFKRGKIFVNYLIFPHFITNINSTFLNLS